MHCEVANPQKRWLCLPARGTAPTIRPVRSATISLATMVLASIAGFLCTHVGCDSWALLPVTSPRRARPSDVAVCTQGHVVVDVIVKISVRLAILRFRHGFGRGLWGLHGCWGGCWIRRGCLSLCVNHEAEVSVVAIERPIPPTLNLAGILVQRHKGGGIAVDIGGASEVNPGAVAT